MRKPWSLQARLAISLGLLLTLLWAAAASVTALLLRGEINQVFDSALQETAERLLPLAVMDIVGREDDAGTQRLGALRERNEYFTYVVRDGTGRILLQSHHADPNIFPPYDGAGFRQTEGFRIYNDDALKGTVRISVAEPMSHRATVFREIVLALGLPLLLVIPIALAVIIFAVRASLAPLRRFRKGLAGRGSSDLSAVPADGLPAELKPLAASLNDVLARLKAAFEAERSFASHAAHELRTPLAGAIAQAQRLRGETGEPAAAARAAEIEATLKRLTRLSERLMQLARAEGGRLRLDQPRDLRPAARIVTEDAARGTPEGRVTLRLPAAPVLSDLDPDAFGILLRNLIENALRHGAADGPVAVTLAADGLLTVANDGPVVPPETLARLTRRFERGGSGNEGSGLGLAIVAAIAGRLNSTLILRSPATGRTQGFEAAIRLPLAADQTVTKQADA
ncbi:MAG: sensor histidine kinase N-terminal domain-containing protein [Aestuariivirga sp.]|uniref:sensor histidine kinase n=1 Tax=Aestuariivirga sp. TaxID=2650926 RepID=UPI0025BFCADB|nr:ATP-binding protein [Aestuariivirga sp.]MCA3562085.1 sensor histidine kinase N-terminal domain-containing protein [Aestuariivirga sp.]